MLDNCKVFNEDDSPIGKAGHSMRRYFHKRSKELKGVTRMWSVESQFFGQIRFSNSLGERKLCCTHSSKTRCIFVSRYSNNCIHKTKPIRSVHSVFRQLICCIWEDFDTFFSSFLLELFSFFFFIFGLSERNLLKFTLTVCLVIPC